MSKINQPTDSDLVKAFQSGDQKALIPLVKRWHKIFCDKAYWVVKDVDVAKYIAQESWQAIMNKMDKLKHPNRFGSWALRIVYNKSIDAINKNNRQLRVQDELKHQSSNDWEVEVDDSAIKRKLLKSINTLPSHQQRVLRLFYVQDYSLKEISDLEQISVGTAKSRLFHAREKLKQILKNRYYEN